MIRGENRMAVKKKSASTEELFQLLQNTQQLEEFLTAHEEDLPSISTPAYLQQMLTQHNISKQSALEAANLNYSLGYQILNGYRNPSRNALIRLALGIGLTINETQRLLKVAQRGELYPRNRRDAALIYCIQHQTSVIDAEILLEQIGEKLLG